MSLVSNLVTKVFQNTPKISACYSIKTWEVIVQMPEEGFTLTIEKPREWIQKRVGKMKYRLTGDDENRIDHEA